MSLENINDEFYWVILFVLYENERKEWEQLRKNKPDQLELAKQNWWHMPMN